MYRTNDVPTRLMSESKTGCCPPFNPEDWDGQTFKFDKKQFMRFTTRSIFHIPLNMGSAMTRAMAKVSAAHAEAGDRPLTLSEDTSLWKSYHYIAVSREVPHSTMVQLSGVFLAKVFEGHYSQMGQWHKDLLLAAQKQGASAKKIYFYYTMCPKCARSYGKNYVVGFVQIAEAIS